MQNFEYHKAKSVAELKGLAQTGKFLAGGTTLIDLMKLNVEVPTQIIDVNALQYSKIDVHPDGRVFVGSLVRNTEFAHHDHIAKRFSVLSKALLSGASVQLRNKATTGGNLLQRTRCLYFRDASKPCNKRQPGSGCAAIKGYNRNLAILGTSENCIANNPSDMNVALMALGATIHILGERGEREMPIQDFYVVPGSTPHIENKLGPGEFITGVTLKPLPSKAKTHYLKLRDRQSYEFALASAAIVSEVKGGKLSTIQIAMGGVGTIPWRCEDAEKFLLGNPATPANFKAAAEIVLKNARPQSLNGFKVELAKRCLTHALQEVTA